MTHPLRRRSYFSFGGRRKDDASTTSLRCGSCSFPSCQMNRHCCTTVPTMKKTTSTTANDTIATSIMDDSTSISSTQSQHYFHSTPTERRSVTFSPNLEDIIPTLHINDYTFYERKQSWYGSIEYNEMKASIKDVLSRMVTPPDDDDDSSSSSSSFMVDVTVDVHLHDNDNQDNCSCCCIRGLEDRIIPSMVGEGRRGRVQQQKQQKQIRSRLINAILKEQANISNRCQNNNKGSNIEALAHLSKTISLPSRQLARQRALFDEQDAAAAAATM